MRVVKSAEERKNEILDCAEELFIQKGFDGTSTNDILQKVGIARGTLYHHFKSKEDILDAIIDRYNAKVLQQIENAVNQKELPVIDQLLQAIFGMNVTDSIPEEVMTQLHKPQNALMHQKTQKVLFNEVTPLLVKIVDRGIAEGVFKTEYPYESMEMLLVYGNIVFDEEMIDMTEIQRMEHIQAFAYNAERLLGLESGEISHKIMELFKE